MPAVDPARQAREARTRPDIHAGQPLPLFESLGDVDQRSGAIAAGLDAGESEEAGERVQEVLGLDAVRGGDGREVGPLVPLEQIVHIERESGHLLSAQSQS